ncbi:MAG: hypothetical protein WKG07_02190 [Hymenobacter sp.]
MARGLGLGVMGYSHAGRRRGSPASTGRAKQAEKANLMGTAVDTARISAILDVLLAVAEGAGRRPARWPPPGV